ncbi:hypothetical protein OVY48_10085 [Sphingobium sp. SA2]|nr:hypothetical protein [Sphingobium sp. SA2]MDT7533773.1 hypothetical protein [Sphingobium sp. SA2]
MLNEWSDREPDPPGRKGCQTLLFALVTLGTLGFFFGLVVSIWRN